MFRLCQSFHVTHETLRFQKNLLPKLVSGQKQTQGFLHTSFFFFFFFFFIRVQLIYSVVPISAVQHSDPVIYIYTFFSSYYLPSCSIPRDYILFPVLYSKISLLIHFKCNSLHLLTPNFQSIPLSPHFPLTTTSLLSMSVSLFLFCR